MQLLKPISFRPVILISRLASSKQTYYDVLKVKRTASTKEIRDAFLELSKKHHPDKQEGDVDLFKRINEAYTVLSREHSRFIYDQSLISGITKSYEPTHPADFEFWRVESLGAHHFGSPSRRHRSQERSQAKTVLKIILTFAAASYFFSLILFIQLSRDRHGNLPLRPHPLWRSIAIDSPPIRTKKD
ncbi:hypothetical protein EG68_06410 [Paragonimus skrjabini miyazakii]|uniref:J domain-containing protein n=1 Tax=Paragonimus skrjabini miyazakii TaxID=59628 RepID=A0A8S9YTQ9_9TREM|nr:hypothetical protein EG68_06410 [Paragonimus skrjabini miyazakii]